MKRFSIDWGQNIHIGYGVTRRLGLTVQTFKAKLGRVGSKRTRNAPGLTYENLGTRVVAVERWSLHHGEGAHFDDVKLPLYAPDRREDVT